MAESENWLLDAGDRVIERKATRGYPALSPLERLIYCFWVADYGMRNAGDLATAADLHPAFLGEGSSAARTLGLPVAAAAFQLSPHEFEQRYFELFDDLVAEIRTASSACDHGSATADRQPL